MNSYTLKYKFKFLPFWKTVEAMGHQYDPKSNRFEIHLAGRRGLINISNWNLYDLKLGDGWVQFVEENEKKAKNIRKVG